MQDTNSYKIFDKVEVRIFDRFLKTQIKNTWEGGKKFSVSIPGNHLPEVNGVNFTGRVDMIISPSMIVRKITE